MKCCKVCGNIETYHTYLLCKECFKEYSKQYEKSEDRKAYRREYMRNRYVKKPKRVKKTKLKEIKKDEIKEMKVFKIPALPKPKTKLEKWVLKYRLSQSSILVSD